jgi:hypothetical protein
MAETKFGLSQVEKPAPLWYRRLTNATILSFIPAYVGIVQAVPMADSKRNILMCVAAAVPFVLKGIGMLMGNGQIFQPSNEKTDQVNSKP